MLARIMFLNKEGQLFAALIVIMLTETMAEETTTENDLFYNSTSINGNNTQDAYVIKSVQFEIGVMEDGDEGSGESGTTPAPAQTDKLTETKVAFLIPPAAVFNSTQPTSTPP